MFQFPGYAPLARYHAFSMVGCPIRTPADHVLFADPRSFSQLITSFVASESLGILHTLFSYFFFQVIRLLLLMTRLCARFTREVSFSRIAPENIDPFYYSSIFNMSMNSLLGLLAQTPFRNGSSLPKDLNIRQRLLSQSSMVNRPWQSPLTHLFKNQVVPPGQPYYYLLLLHSPLSSRRGPG